MIKTNNYVLSNKYQIQTATYTKRYTNIICRYPLLFLSLTSRPLSTFRIIMSYYPRWCSYSHTVIWNILSQLIKWKNGTNRKPLIINGARQVGKTYILKEFGCTQYKNTAYVNCDNNDTIEKIFSQGYDIRRIILSLSAVTHIRIKPHHTLISAHILFQANDSRIEIDFIVQKGATVIPVKVKAEVNVKSK